MSLTLRRSWTWTWTWSWSWSWALSSRRPILLTALLLACNPTRTTPPDPDPAPACGVGGERFTEYGFVPPTVRAAARLRLDDPSFEPLLEEYRKRFAATGTEQGLVMAAVLGYAIQETFQGRRGTILAEYRSSDRIQVVFREAQAEREVRLATEDR